MTTPSAGRSPGWRLGSVGGVPVYLAPSWLIVAAVLTVLFLPTVRAAAPGLSGPMSLVAASSFPILLFASVFVHELSHGTVARACGVRVREYVLTFWGGHTSFGSDLRTPGVSALVSAAGPFANLLLAGLGWLLLRALPPGLPAVVVASLVYTNLVVAVFNLLPGNPLDGGRILEALIWKVTGSRETGLIGAGWVGRILAVGIAVVVLGLPLLRGSQPTITSAIWVVLIAGLVWQGASQSIRLGKSRRNAAHVDVRSLLVPAVVLPADATISEIPATPWGVRLGATVLVDGRGEVVAVVDQAALVSVPQELRSTTPLSAVARALPRQAVITEVVGPDALAQVARGLQVSDVLVAVGSAGVLGTLDRDRLVAAFSSR
ncbi:site-2 protease family protein [Salana multivorans]